MFILKACRVDGDQYVIGYSEDKSQLDYIVTQYKAATRTSSGKRMSFNEAPETIGFGNLLLTKSADCFRYKFSHDYSKVIGYDDYLSIEEIKRL